jgi:hypothetical protein
MADLEDRLIQTAQEAAGELTARAQGIRTRDDRIAELEGQLAPAPLQKGLQMTWFRDGVPTPPFGLGYVPAVRWDAIEPRHRVLNLEPIDRHLEAGAKRIRFFFGHAAPEELKAKYGSFPHTSFGGRKSTVLRWWNLDALDHHAWLQSRLAQYDGDLSVVFASWAMSQWAEMFQRAWSQPGNREAYEAAGYDEEADRTSLIRVLEDMQVWKRTNIGIAYNPFQVRGGNDPAFTVEVMHLHRQMFGPRAVRQNNSLGNPAWRSAREDKAAHYAVMYEEMARLGPPTSFQTGGDDEMGDDTTERRANLKTAMDWALGLGAHVVETTGGLLQLLGPADVQRYDELLRAA